MMLDDDRRVSARWPYVTVAASMGSAAKQCDLLSRELAYELILLGIDSARHVRVRILTTAALFQSALRFHKTL